MFPPNTPSWTAVLEELVLGEVWVPVVALLVGLLSTPLFRWIALRRGIIDRPDAAVKIHARPIPYLGGCGIWLAWTTAMVMHVLLAGPEHPRAEWALVVGGVVAFLVGLSDDLWDLPPKVKLAGQAAAGAVLLAGGILWRAYPAMPWFPLADFGEDFWFVWIVCLGMHFFVVIGATNATNLLDGLDGLCSGVSAIISVGFLVLALSLTAWANPAWNPHPMEYEYTRLTMVVALALVGAAIGFLPYNFNPARIFMGDAGSVFIGYVLAAMMIMFASKFGMVKWFVGALFMFGVPIFDTAMALARRVLNRRPIMMPDRSHLYNQLIDRLGFGAVNTVAVFYVTTAIFVGAGLLVLYLRGRWAMLLYVILAAVFLAIVWRLGLLRMTPEERAAADRYIERKRGAS